ncbi:MAG: hypothetical protein LBG52_08135 [Candidatus Peribacteria bacterium]|jgi:hypothetical protein|nr:hypothetical protein [Candidatus Peribacteria bacterium]
MGALLFLFLFSFQIKHLFVPEVVVMDGEIMEEHSGEDGGVVLTDGKDAS